MCCDDRDVRDSCEDSVAVVVIGGRGLVVHR